MKMEDRTHTLRAALLIGCAAACGAFAQNLPSADSILDRYVEVTGGKAAYQKHTTEVWTGTIAFPSQGLKGRLTRYAAPPDQEYSAVELEGLGKLESGVQNGYPWERNAITGPRIKAGDERDQALHESYFYAAIEWRMIYARAETKGTAMVNGEECYEVSLTPVSGKPEQRFYSRKSGLLVRITMRAASQFGEVDVEEDLSDYKEFGGILFHTKSRSKAAGQEVEITIDRVGVNEAIPAGGLDAPEEVAVIIRKAIAAAAGKL